jgi:hypothetical protein
MPDALAAAVIPGRHAAPERFLGARRIEVRSAASRVLAFPGEDAVDDAAESQPRHVRLGSSHAGVVTLTYWPPVSAMKASKPPDVWIGLRASR